MRLLSFKYFKRVDELNLRNLTEVIYTTFKLTEFYPPLYRWLTIDQVVDSLLYHGLIIPEDCRELKRNIDIDMLMNKVERLVWRHKEEKDPKSYIFCRNVVASYACALIMLSDRDKHFKSQPGKSLHMSDVYFNTTMYNIGALDESCYSPKILRTMERSRTIFKSVYEELPDETWNALKALHF